jgi:hypothetical protein
MRRLSGIRSGPLLFLLYRDELPLNIRDARLVVFADDTYVLITDKSGCSTRKVT